MNFDGKSFIELTHQLFGGISNRYDLEIVNIRNDVMELKGNKFSVFFTYYLDTTLVYYFDKKNDKTYLISNYINVNAEDIDRKDIPKEDIISKEIERTLKIQARVLSRKFGDLLSGKDEWFVSYKKSQFFQESKAII
ncbi:MAG: hypothetical protein RR929_00945 [Erysipelotrichaceae bacterium]